jgi:hypothetical protein
MSEVGVAIRTFLAIAYSYRVGSFSSAGWRKASLGTKSTTNSGDAATFRKYSLPPSASTCWRNCRAWSAQCRSASVSSDGLDR